MKKTRFALWQSLISLLLCISMLIGSTFAWFTDSVASGNNIIKSGNLDVEMYWTDDLTSNNWRNAEDEADGVPFDYDNWEPGYTEVRYVKVVNAGNLALKYALSLGSLGQVGKLAEVIGVYYSAGVTENIADRSLSGMTSLGYLKDAINGGNAAEGALLPAQEIIVAVALHMDEKAGNEYQKQSVGDGFVFKLVATQAVSESDSFDNTYDKDALFPEIEGGSAGVSVKDKVDADNKLTEDVSITSADGRISAIVPKGTLLKAGVQSLQFSVTPKAGADSNVTLEENEQISAWDVHIEGLDKNNTVPALVTVTEAMAKGLNIGNYSIYHLENGQTVKMTAGDLTVHNGFTYDPATGDVVLALASFSEVALVADTENAWKGKFDYTWYDASKADLTIANADQLAAFGAIVGGMNGQTRDSFAGKTVKLIADINLGDKESENNPDIIFYPIGYYNSTGSYTRTNDSITSSVSSFKGTFDGNGHTIANFYQNTWEMFGDDPYYSAGANYYNDAMGLFGYVLNGTVKNLTVKNFSSDGEYTPTGVIAAYADGNSIFENIAITNCNPRVYNTGNGGIIGIAGDTSAANDDHIILKNITVDNSNKISALWGSWDVACGGLVGMYRGNVDGSGNATGDTISFTNCHVSAQIDVYNDVCANYQYYAYRYSGMIIGSVRHNTTKDGKTIPNMTGISATGCTVHFGTWNDYYYCEIIDNTTASYTHDYQMSRLTEIKAIDGTTITYLDGTTGTVPASGRANYVIVDYDEGHGTENATCYHFKDGAVWTHDMGGIQTGIDENGDGQDDLKEDKQHIYLEFKNLFTGYGWGVSSMGIDKWNGITALDVTTGDHENSVEKFEGKVNELANNNKHKLGDIFSFVDKGVELVPGALTVTVTNLDENNPVSATIEYNRENWENGTISFTGTGKINITIQDYYFCTPTTIEVTVTDRQPEVKFDVVMNNGDFLHRVGNIGTVALDKLFKAKNGVTVGTVSVTIEAVNSTGASGTYSNNAIQFNGTGVVKVTITDNVYCTPTELYLEVVDAVNATGATNATANNVVLLNDCGFSSLEVSGGYTLYGNGFTMTCGSDSPALDFGYAFVKLDNGTLDNVQIVCPNFDYAALYKENLTSAENRSQTTDRTRYFNAKSGVMVSGNSQILNSRISGGRAAVNLTGGDLVIDNSRIELGAVASILVGAANSLTLRDVTLVQKPTASTYNPSKKLMGFSVLYLCDSNGNATPTTLEGSFVQHAWADENDKQYVPNSGKNIVTEVLKKTEYLHDIDGDGTNESVNLGFAYMPENSTDTILTPTNIEDERTDRNKILYDNAEVSYVKTFYVYSYKNTNGTDESFKTESKYVPNKYGDIITVNYSDNADGLTTGKSFGTNGWVYELNVDLDKASGYKIDFSKLSMVINGVSVTDFKVNGGAKPTSPVAVTSGGNTYTLTATVNGKEYTATYKVTGTETSKESPSLVASNYEAGLCVASSYGGTWHGAAPALQGIQIKYWSVAEKKYKTITLSDYTPTTKGQLNGTNTTWTYSPTNGDFTLTLTGGQVHSSNNVYAMPVVVDNNGVYTLYFVAAKSNGLVNSGNSARAIPVTYTFKDNNNGDVLTFSHTWSVAENKDAQYKYSDFCNGTLTKLDEGCVTEGTLITMADGTQKPVENLVVGDMVMVFNHITGQYEASPLIFNTHANEVEAKEYDVLHLLFANGKEIEVVSSHGFFDVTTLQYVYIDYDNYLDYIGHEFYAMNADGTAGERIELIDAYIAKEITRIFCPVTYFHMNSFANGFLNTPNIPGGITGLVNYFEYDEDLKYNEEAMMADIEEYGLYTYDDFKDYISEAAYLSSPAVHLKVAVGKGMITFEEILVVIEYLLSGSLIS